MDINLIEAILYGVISGFTEFMPVSSQAHRKMLLTLFGTEGSVALLDFFVHIGLLVAVLAATAGSLKQASKEYRLLRKSPRRRKREPNMQLALDFRLLRMAMLPLILSVVLRLKTASWIQEIPLVAIFLCLNGLLLYIPSLVSSGNKDSRNMSSFDGILFGVGGALSALPGVSCVGASSTMALFRGADIREAYKWSLMLSVPALAILSCLDLYGTVVGGFGGVDLFQVLLALLSGCAAYFAGSLAITFMKTLVADKGITAFSFYSWGLALLIFILYLY